MRPWITRLPLVQVRVAGEEQRVLVLTHEIVDLLELGMVGVAVGMVLGDEGVLGVRVGVGELRG